MNPIVIQFANGNIFFIGIAMVVIASAFYLRNNNSLVRLMLSVISIAGIAFVILSATPLPKWLYGIWLGVCISGWIVNKIEILSDRMASYRLLVFGLSTIVSLILTLLELPYHFSSKISVSADRHFYVVGDSLSAGIDEGERTWPAVLGDLAHLKVNNLARAGATAGSALAQASVIVEKHCLIIVEIGGNDLIGGPDGRTFYAQMDSLLDRLCAGDNQVIMLEIPLFPLRNSFGKTQRILAAKHGVKLLPKKLLANIIGMKDGTLDGLHFSQAGHDAMAKQIFELLSFQNPS